MDLLQVKGSQIVDAHGQPVMLRGTCIGGWMNMENFLNGYPGTESGVRAAMAQELGSGKAAFFFERLLDYTLAEEDIAFIRACGATVVRLPLNYRHFERDEDPFVYREAGFERLSRAVEWCARHGLYVILDLHAVQGSQNPDWHSDAPSRQNRFWHSRQDQDRFVALWEEFARRFNGNPTIAGYNLMNEPVTDTPRGFLLYPPQTEWAIFNAIYRRTVTAIRAIDPDHIIFLEGDLFSNRFDQLDPPFADNLVYSSHNYTPACWGPGPYPGTYPDSIMPTGAEYWDSARTVQALMQHEGTHYARQHNVPLWVGEFGSVFDGPPQEEEDRLQALEDQVIAFNAHALHWTTWTYKDVGVMGWLRLHPDSDYMQVVRPVIEKGRELHTDSWRTGRASRSAALLDELTAAVHEVLALPDLNPALLRRGLANAAMSSYASDLLQYTFARQFKGMSEAGLDRILQSWKLDHCQPREGYITLMKRHLAAPERQN